jgi:hypothetical protein
MLMSPWAGTYESVTGPVIWTAPVTVRLLTLLIVTLVAFHVPLVGNTTAGNWPVAIWLAFKPVTVAPVKFTVLLVNVRLAPTIVIGT